MNKFIMILLLWIGHTSLGFALSGIVLEEGSNDPVPYASVYINNTTYQTYTNDKGVFTLKEIPEPPFQISIAASGFYKATRKVTGQNINDTMIIILRNKATEIGEVIITAPEKDGWKKYGETFLRELIGYSSFSKKCRLKNKEAILFRFDIATGILTAWADQPLIIENHATGYIMTYYLEDFSLNYFERTVHFKGELFFKAMVTQSSKKKKQWEENRERSYKGSANHFFRSLYKGRQQEEGFEIRLMKRIDPEEKDSYIPRSTDTMPVADASGFRRIFEAMLDTVGHPGLIEQAMDTLYTWWGRSGEQPLRLLKQKGVPEGWAGEYVFLKYKAGTENVIIKYFEYRRKDSLPADAVGEEMQLMSDTSMNSKVKVGGKGLPKLPPRPMEILYTDILQVDSCIVPTAANEKKVSFNDYWHITYIHEREERPYVDFQYKADKAPAEQQKSIISLWNKEQGMNITPEGNYYDPYNMLIELYWSYEKLDKQMPLNYKGG